MQSSRAIADSAEVLKTLSAAFSEDPFATYYLPDAGKRAKWLPAGMELFVRLAQKSGQVHVVGEGAAGVLAVFPPGSYPIPESTALREMIGVLVRRRAYTAPWGPAMRFLKLLTYFDGKHLRGPHWYVMVVGVHPEFQGRGLSRKLLEPVLRQADEQGLPTYLENSNPRNLPIYRGFGFETLEEVRPHGPKGPSAWLMLRKPSLTSGPRQSP